jgi:hypothetical protein
MSASVQEKSAEHHNGSPSPSGQRQEREPSARGQERLPSTAVAPPEGEPAERIREAIKSPAAGATVAGMVVMSVASVFGVTEALIGVGAAYGVYLIAKRRQGSR